VIAIPADLRRALAERYELEEPIGRGGMATVYRARDVKHGRHVAVKVLRPDLGELIGPERFHREIEIAARLTHPNILPLYDSGEAAGALYYVMPFVEGESLRGLLSRVGLMDTEGALELVRRVADALDYAHGEGILHRDIKPENILLPGGQAVLADFGIAKAISSATSPGNLTRTGIALGTPGYMSPEQAAGLLDLDATTDVYSLAIVTYEMLVGGLPGAWITPDQLTAGRFLEATAEHRTPLDRLPTGMERGLLRALALRPEDRFPSAGEFASALERPETVPLTARRAAPVVPAPAAHEPLPAARPYVAAPAEQLASESALLGAPTMIRLDRIIEGEVPSEEFPALVEEIRATFGVMGHLATTERSMLWTGRPPKKPFNVLNVSELLEAGTGDGPDALVRIAVRGGLTRIQIEQRLGDIAGGVYGGVWGGVGGGGLGIVFGVGIGALGLPLGLVFAGAAGTIAGSYALARAIYRAVVGSKGRRIELLLDRLVEHCEETAE
jgi:tRNA A-37 threonylcarbamoyl transferase component Bud32